MFERMKRNPLWLMAVSALVGTLIGTPIALYHANANVGPYYGGQGTNNVVGIALDKAGNQRITQGNPKYYAANEDQKLFAACHNAGDAPGTTISTTAMACLYNPQGSGVNLVLCKVTVAYVSGTIGTGTMFHTVNMTNTQTAPSGTAATGGVVNLSGGGAGQGLYSSTSTVVAPKVTRPFIGLAPYLASSVVAFPIYTEDMDGEILLPPGTSYQLQSIAAAGTSPLFAAAFVWREIPAN